MKDIFSRLNPSQIEAVISVGGPVLVVAGAGTGKTRVIEYRVLYMIQKGISPYNILMLTFTRRAAREMLNRASRHDERCHYVVSGTFHSFAYRVLKEHGDEIGLKDFSFIDQGDAEDILHKLSTNLGLFDKHKRFPKKETVQKIISGSINREKSIEEIIEEEYPHFAYQSLKKDLENLAEEFFQYKFERGYIDYDDLLLYLKELLSDEIINEHFASIHKYVMVDEFQDTNRIQAEIIYRLCRKNRNILVVGDDAQSIYRFRGAYFQNMFDFPKKFEGTYIIKLEQNYRSTQPVLDVANNILIHAKEKYTKVLKSIKEGGATPILKVFNQSDEEYAWIGTMIKKHIDEGIPMHHICVLYRASYLSAGLQLELSKRHIPFAVFGGLKFTEMAHVKDVISHLKILINPRDEIAWSRVLMLVPGIGPGTSEYIIQEILKTSDYSSILSNYSKGKKYSDSLSQLIKTLLKAGKLNEEGKIDKVIELIDEYYLPLLEMKFDDYHKRMDDLVVLEELASKYNDARDFLADFSLLEPEERIFFREEEEGIIKERPVTLSTIHSAKGLEWDIVFIMSVMDGNLPSYYSFDDDEKIEEERRLFYVAITRCKRSLYLSLHRYGMRQGMPSTFEISRFLRSPEIISKFIHNLKNFEYSGLSPLNRDRFYDGIFRRFKESL